MLFNGFTFVIEFKKVLMNALKTKGRLLETIQVSCLNKAFVENDHEACILFEFMIKNKSEKTVRSIKGGITFNTLFDEKIQTLNFVYGQLINSGAQKIYKASVDYNRFTNEDRVLKEKKLDEIKIIWIPEKVIFEDGSSLS